MHIRSIWGEVDPVTYELGMKVELHDGTRLTLRNKNLDIHELFKKLNENKVKVKYVLTIEP